MGPSAPSTAWESWWCTAGRPVPVEATTTPLFSTMHSGQASGGYYYSFISAQVSATEQPGVLYSNLQILSACLQYWEKCGNVSSYQLSVRRLCIVMQDIVSNRVYRPARNKCMNKWSSVLYTIPIYLISSQIAIMFC